MKIFVILACVFALLLCACSSPSAELDVADTEALYGSFIAQREENNDGCYAVYDMNGDAVSELLIKTTSDFSIYWVKNGAVTLWCSGSEYTNPLNDGTLLYVREGAAPQHMDYIYQVLNYQGDVVFRVEFSEYEPTEFQGVQYGKQYYINGTEVTEAVYDSVVGDLLSLKSDNIQWKPLSD